MYGCVLQGVQGMHAMQYAAVPGYGFVPRSAPDGMPAAMAAAGMQYAGMQYPPGVYPMQLAMPQHTQQVRRCWSDEFKTVQLSCLLIVAARQCCCGLVSS